MKLPLKLASCPFDTELPEHNFVGHCPFKDNILLVEVGTVEAGAFLVGVLALAVLVFFFIEEVFVADEDEGAYEDDEEDGDDDGDDDVDMDALFFLDFPCHGAWAPHIATKHRNTHALSRPIVQRVDRTVKSTGKKWKCSVV